MMKFLVLALTIFAVARAYSGLPRAIARKSMSVKAFDMSTLQTAVEVVAKPDGQSITHSLTHPHSDYFFRLCIW